MVTISVIDQLSDGLILGRLFQANERFSAFRLSGFRSSSSMVHLIVAWLLLLSHCKCSWEAMYVEDVSFKQNRENEVI